MTTERPRISAEFLAVHKRARIIEAMAELSAEKGYEETTITDLTTRARVARQTLYGLFGGKEAVFLAAVEASRDALNEQLGAACEAVAEEPPERLCAALAALLAYVEDKPGRAHLLLVEAPSALPDSTALYDREFVLLAERLRACMPASAPEAIEEALVGAVASILNRCVRRGEAGRANELLPDLEGLFLAPWGEPDL